MGDFNFSDADPNDTLAKVKITTLPGTDEGTLSLDDTAITNTDLPQTVTKAELDTDKLTYTPASDEYGVAYTDFEFKVNDGSDDSASAYTITVNVNDSPEITGGDTDIEWAENTPKYFEVGHYPVTDLDTAVVELTWSLAQTGDYAAFSSTIWTQTGGSLAFSSSPNYENPVDADGDNVYEVTLVVSDDYSADSVAVTVTVTDEPAVSGSTAIQYAENGTGTVATYTTSETVTWSLEGDDNGDFTISTGGALSFASPPDYENPADADTDNFYDVTVVATDGSEPGGWTSPWRSPTPTTPPPLTKGPARPATSTRTRQRGRTWETPSPPPTRTATP